MTTWTPLTSDRPRSRRRSVAPVTLGVPAVLAVTGCVGPLAPRTDEPSAAGAQGEGHTAHGRSNECVSEAVEAYLIEGTIPPEGERC